MSNETNERPQTDATPTVRYGKLTLSQLIEAILESDMTTLDGYATHKQLEGYKDCNLAKSIHGTGLCLKVRHTLTMRENDEPKEVEIPRCFTRNRTRRTEHVANIPLPHLI